MNEFRHDWMSSELPECDDDERQIRLAELCGCGWLDPVELKRVDSAKRTQAISQNQLVSVLTLPRTIPPEAGPGLTFGRRAA
jgi:hypothetical protein